MPHKDLDVRRAYHHAYSLAHSARAVQRTAEWRQGRYDLGLCRSCNQKHPEGRPFCDDCRKSHSQIAVDNQRKRNYGLAPTDIATLLLGQDNCCAICKQPFDFSNRQAFHVDHVHGSRTVRGLLCQLCNRGIGMLKEDPVILRSAAEYVS